MFEKIDQLIKKAVEDGEIAGGNCLCVKDGKELFYFEQGYADIENQVPIKRDTIFRLYSMTKPITSAAVMMLMERGEIDLLEPVSKYLEGFRNQSYYEKGKIKPLDFPMNIKNLLSMTSGLTYPGEQNETEKATKVIFDRLTDGLKEDNKYSNYGTVEAMNDIGRNPLAFRPGSRWNYSASADVLGALVEVVSGMPFSQFLQKNLFEPLEMTDTGFYVPKEKQCRLAKSYEAAAEGMKEYTGDHLAIQNRMERPPVFESGGAGLCATIGDYMKFLQMLMNSGIYNGRRILKPKTVEFMTKGQLTKEQQPSMDWDGLAGYSYGNLMRVLAYPELATHLCTKGEYGWDGWLGVYMMNVPSERLSFLFMIQQKDSGTLPLTRKIKNILYSEIENN